MVPSRHLLAQSKRWKQQKNVWNWFKVNNKDIRTTAITSNHIHQSHPILTRNRFHTLFLCFYCWVWTSKCQVGAMLEIYQRSHIPLITGVFEHMTRWLTAQWVRQLYCFHDPSLKLARRWSISFNNVTVTFCLHASKENKEGLVVLVTAVLICWPQPCPPLFEIFQKFMKTYLYMQESKLLYSKYLAFLIAFL